MSITFIEGPPRILQIQLPDLSDIASIFGFIADLEEAVKNPPVEPAKQIAFRSVVHRLRPFADGLRYNIDWSRYEGYSSFELNRLHQRIHDLFLPLACVCPPTLTSDVVNYR